MSAPAPAASSPAVKWTGAALFGLAFGFLLQKGGVAKYNILIGQLLLQDFTVIKVMMSAVVVGMIGVHILHRLGMAKLQVKPLRIAAQATGGLIFGAGFALLAYCPGTGAAALGQGSWDVLFGMAGLIAGSYLFAELSAPLARTIGGWGEMGKRVVARRLPAVFAVAAVLAAALAILEYYFPR